MIKSSGKMLKNSVAVPVPVPRIIPHLDVDDPHYLPVDTAMQDHLLDVEAWSIQKTQSPEVNAD